VGSVVDDGRRGRAWGFPGRGALMRRGESKKKRQERGGGREERSGKVNKRRIGRKKGLNRRRKGQGRKSGSATHAATITDKEGTERTYHLRSPKNGPGGGENSQKKGSLHHGSNHGRVGGQTYFRETT